MVAYKLVSILLLVAALFVAKPTEAVEDLSSCDDLPPMGVVTAPQSDVSQDFARFSGEWRGKWGGSRCSNLVVRYIDNNGRVELTYSIASWRSFPEFSRSYVGQIKDGELTFGNRRVQFSFWFSREQLRGQYVRGEQNATVTMQKKEKEAEATPEFVLTKDISSLLKQFLGTWKGSFQRGGRGIELIVRSISPTGEANVVYALEANDRFGASKRRANGKINDGLLEFGLTNGAKLTYWISNEGVMVGEWKRGGRKNKMELRKAD